MALTRRSLFGLIPAPLAGACGLLTTSAAVNPAPESDPLAVVALAVARDLDLLDVYPGHFARMRALPPRRGLSPAEMDRFEREQIAYTRSFLDPAEAELKARLRGLRGLAVAINGRVYAAPGRGSQVVRPVRVALLTPAEEGVAS